MNGQQDPKETPETSEPVERALRKRLRADADHIDAALNTARDHRDQEYFDGRWRGTLQRYQRWCLGNADDLGTDVTSPEFAAEWRTRATEVGAVSREPAPKCAEAVVFSGCGAALAVTLMFLLPGALALAFGLCLCPVGGLIAHRAAEHRMPVGPDSESVFSHHRVCSSRAAA